MFGQDNKNNKSLGLTLIEALVSAAIVGIGFISIFQMVNYAIQSIDVSGERTKSNYLVSMVAEDLMADKNSVYGGKKFYEHLLATTIGADNGWKMGSCSTGSTSTATFANATQNKMRKWDNRFSKKRIKCKGPKDIKALKIFEICHSGCKYTNVKDYIGHDKLHFGRMEVNLNNGKKRKYLYFQID